MLRLVQRAHSASTATGMERRTQIRLCTVAQPNGPKKPPQRLRAKAVLTAWRFMTVGGCRAALSIRTMNTVVAVVVYSASSAAVDRQYILGVNPDAFIASICVVGSLIEILIVTRLLAFAHFNSSRIRYDVPTTIFHHPSHVLPHISMKTRTVKAPGSVF